MAQAISCITEKIVAFTGNEETRQFIGKTVARKTTKDGAVYEIGNSGYVLSVDEYKMFTAAGAIARMSKKSMIARKHAKQQEKKAAEQATTDNEPAMYCETEIVEQPVADYDDPEYDDVSAFISVDLDSSPFLASYPEPQFNIDKPKHAGLFDKGEDMKEKLSGFFDAIGRRGRDKIISAMEGEENRL